MISDLRIELATPADATAIAEMSRSEIEHGLPWRWRPSRVMTLMDDGAANVAVVRGLGEVGNVSAFGIMSYGEVRAHLLLFAVHAAHRRAGTGSALLEWLEIVARVAGISTITAEARADNANGIAFYRKHGYTEAATIRRMYSGMLDGVRLEKTLSVEQI